MNLRFEPTLLTKDQVGDLERAKQCAVELAHSDAAAIPDPED
jgi:hypothetical protein